MSNTAYFLDFEFDTHNSTFFPRPETEILVEKAYEILSQDRNNACHDILDIGTGCGNISIGLTKYLPSSRIVALDINDSAVRTASENAKKHGVSNQIKFIKCNLFEALGDSHRNFFDLLISNPPYVSYEDFVSLPSNVKNDPYIALYGGRDGLRYYRIIAEKAAYYLKKEGVLLFEIGYNQRNDVCAILNRDDVYDKIEIYKDYSGIDRVVKARLA